MCKKWLQIACLGVVFYTTAYAQSSAVVPRLRSADLPRYPPIAEAAKITGWVKVSLSIVQGRVTNARVVEAEARDDKHVWKDGLPLLNTPTLTYLRTWKFDSDVEKIFEITVSYRIIGDATDEPTNPLIEVSPSLDVVVTARPVKPVIMYERSPH